MLYDVKMTVNGAAVAGQVEARTLLAQFIREHLRLTGTHVGCDTTQCGCCVVHVDGVAVKSCTMLAVQAVGRSITTIEGLARGGKLTAVQQAWCKLDVPQCGYCQGGQILCATALLAAKPRPTDADIDSAMSGNFCRCASYTRIRQAIHAAAGQPTAAS